MSIRPCTPADAPALCDIYNHYVCETTVTFEEQPVSREEMAARVAGVVAQWPWLVWADGGTVTGYAYATGWKTRSAYRFSVESTVYLAPGAGGRGVGTRLYGALLDELDRCDLHCVIGGITLPNAASVALHEKLGFEHLGIFREVGRKFGRWLDVGYWQRILPAGVEDS